jgi:metal-dependent amidase/aminoacylase/carboxypeptidase family protein
MTVHPNAALEARWVANAAAYGIVDQGPDPSAGSTDMGNVSWHCPTIHPELAIAPEGTAGHSTAFRDAAATPAADRTTLLAATLVAQTAVDLYLDPALVEAAWEAFRAQRG